jgi:hypothetical protein
MLLPCFFGAISFLQRNRVTVWAKEELNDLIDERIELSKD